VNTRAASGRDADDRADRIHIWVRHGEQSTTGQVVLLDAGELLLGRARSELVVEHDRDGRPWVAIGNDRLSVSVSHCRAGDDDVVAVAARLSGRVGVDIEPVRTVPAAELARRWFLPREALWVARQGSPDEAFLRLWTAKEAVGKALGSGLRDGGLRRVVPLPDGDPSVLRPVPGETGLSVGYVTVKGFVLAVAADVQAFPRNWARVHDTADRSTERSRTSLPVVVRGN
jgi:phosphopantetheinyl transferase